MTQSKFNIFSRSIFMRILFVLESKAYFLIIGAELHMVSIMPTLLVVNFVYDCSYLFICLFCHLLKRIVLLSPTKLMTVFLRFCYLLHCVFLKQQRGGKKEVSRTKCLYTELNEE